MFEFIVESGKPKLYCKSKLILSILSARLQTDDGWLQDCTSFSVSDQNERQINLVGSEGMPSLRIEAMYGEKTVSLRVRASLEQKKPQFCNVQSFFTKEQAICLEFSAEDGKRKYMALCQHKPWWIHPVFFTGIDYMPQRTQMLMWKQDKFFFILMAVCGKQYRTDLGAGKNGIMAVLSSNCSFLRNCNEISLVLSCGADPYRACEDAVRAALALSDSPNCHRTEKQFPRILEYFGWCSWDAFYHEVDEEGIIKKLEELNRKKVPLGWVLIDDGWSEADYKSQRLTGMDATKEKFPHGLKGTIDIIKKNYGIPYVGVWQAIMGYWNGLELGSKAEQMTKNYTEVLSDGSCVPLTTFTKSFGFWSTWHGYLKKCGVDFIKVDSQSAISIFQRGRRTYGKASAEMHKGLEASAALYFDRQMINCMGMAPQDMWNRVMSSVSRSSDDFVPTVEHGFREHAVQNAYNSLLQGQLYWGDWDMFWSDHDESWQNSVLRAVSGGPVYVSDPVGKTDMRYVTPLILRDGKVLRCDSVGMPTEDCLLEDPLKGGNPLKVFNRYLNCYIVAAFNIGTNEQKAEGTISFTDIPAMPKKPYYIYEWKRRRISHLALGEKFSFTLEPDDAKLFLLVPCQKRITVIGLVDKYIAPATIEEIRWQRNDCIIRLKQGGTFCFTVTAEYMPRNIFVNSKQAKVVLSDGAFYVECSEDERPIVKITL